MSKRKFVRLYCLWCGVLAMFTVVAIICMLIYAVSLFAGRHL